MIRKAEETDFIGEITNESVLRMVALKRAYGLDVPFIQYFADDNDSLAAIMDGFCVFYCADELNDEWRLFFMMHADIAVLHTDERTARAFNQAGQYSITTGKILCREQAESDFTLHSEKPERPPLSEVYALLSHTFDNIPRFDSWYVDASHKLRHGCCHINGMYHKNTLVSMAMTVAETEEIALIGGVATLPCYRGRGYASRCITELISQLSQKKILISPSNVTAELLYQKLGFVPFGTWAEVSLSRQEG